MKSLLWLVLAMLLPVAGTAQDRGSNIDNSNLHPSRDAIPATNFDLQQLKHQADAIKTAAEDCGKDFECPLMDCAAANRLLQTLIEARARMRDMQKWSNKASDDLLAHHQSLVGQSITTSENQGNAILAQGWHEFFHNLGSLLLDIAGLAGTLEDMAQDGLDPSKVKNLDKLYETLKTYESAIDTLADQKAKTSGTGPLNDATAEADAMLGLNNTSTSSLKSDLSDTLSAIENFKGGKPWKGGRDVGQIVGRVLKDISAQNMRERAVRIQNLARDLRAEESVTTAAYEDYRLASTRRNLAEDTYKALDDAVKALIACIRKHCGSISSTSYTPPPSFSGWGQALRYYNALVPRLTTALTTAAGGISFREDPRCAEPATEKEDPFAAVKDLPIVPETYAPVPGTGPREVDSVLDDLQTGGGGTPRTDTGGTHGSEDDPFAAVRDLPIEPQGYHPVPGTTRPFDSVLDDLQPLGSTGTVGIGPNVDDVDEGEAYSEGDFQVPFSGEALNRALNLEEDTDPSSTLEALREQEQQAIEDASKANNYANTVSDAFQQAGSTSIQTASSLAAATEAEGLQRTLINFASALADLASVSDFFENLAKEGFDESLVKNLDSIYEAAKDGESLINGLEGMAEESGHFDDYIVKPPEGADINTSPINDLTSQADELLGTDSMTQLGTMKSHFSDIVNIIDDYKSGKPLNARTLGQLIIRVGKSYAEADLKERQQQIANLQRDLAAEERVIGGLHGDLQDANEDKWEAMDRLEAIRAAIRALLESHPEAMGTPEGTVTGTGESSDVVLTTTDCPACQSVVDQINQARVAINASYRRIAEIESRQQSLEEKKNRLKNLEDRLDAVDSTLRTAREGLKSTDVPVLGPAQEIQNDINLLESDRRQLVNEIGRLRREIEIEEGDPEAEIAALRKAINDLRGRLDGLRYNLYVCEEDQCEVPSEAAYTGNVIGDIFSVEVLDVKHVSGNNPYDRRDPVSEDPEHVHTPSTGDSGGGTTTGGTSGGGTTTGGTSGGGTTTGGSSGGSSGSGSGTSTPPPPPPPEPTVDVINNIPVNRLSLAGPDACPSDHYHGDAYDCDGVFKTDPDPSNCGHGTVGSVSTIPQSSCPDY